MAVRQSARAKKNARVCVSVVACTHEGEREREGGKRRFREK